MTAVSKKPSPPLIVETPARRSGEGWFETMWKGGAVVRLPSDAELLGDFKTAQQKNAEACQRDCRAAAPSTCVWPNCSCPAESRPTGVVT